MSDDRFFERLQHDASALRYEPDEVTLTRIRARIRERIARPTVAELLAAWFRPLAAALTAVAIAASVMLAVTDTPDLAADPQLEVTVAGGTYVVGE